VDVNDLHELSSNAISMNEIAEVEFETNLPLFFDAYRVSRSTGSVILIDSLTNATVGAAMIVAPVADASGSVHRTTLLLLPGNDELAGRVKDALVARGEQAVVIDDALIPEAAVAAVVRALDLAGVVAISARDLSPAALGAITEFAHGEVRTEYESDEEAILRAVAVKL
jgi:bifunctional enzyme CysN/CysC/sulfate adenylyltransferase subunit 1